MPSFLKEPCGCGDDRCKAFGNIDPGTGHSRKCWDGCPVCVKGKKRPGRRIPSTVRRQITVRAGGYCEARILEVCTGQPEHAHHVRRRSQGGGETPGNLKLVCGECHDWIHAACRRARTARPLHL